MEDQATQAVLEFIERTQADEAVAESFLQAHEYDLDAAVMDYQSQLAADDADGEDEGQLDAEEEPDAEEDDTTEDRAAEVHATATHETMDEDDRAGEEDTTATQETPDEEAVSSAPPPSVVSMETAAALDGFGGFGGPAEPMDGDETFKQVDEVAQRLGMEAASLAVEAAAETHKYFAEVASTLQTANVADLSNTLSSWWSNLDSSLGIDTGEKDAAAEPTPAKPTAPPSTELQRLFPELGAAEQLIEQFSCKLLQTYTCSHNDLTPDIQMGFAGTLYITDSHTCFNVEETGKQLPVALTHAQITRVERQRPARKAERNDSLKLTTESGQWLTFKDFKPGNLDSALALLEHLCDTSTTDE